MISRQYGPGGSTPAKPIFRDLALSVVGVLLDAVAVMRDRLGRLRR